MYVLHVHAPSVMALMQDHPLRFAVLFAGVLPRVPEVAQLLTDQLVIPSLHIIGERDKIKRVRSAAGCSCADIVAMCTQHIACACF